MARSGDVRLISERGSLLSPDFDLYEWLAFCLMLISKGGSLPTSDADKMTRLAYRA
jgi:hypothetical protein